MPPWATDSALRETVSDDGVSSAIEGILLTSLMKYNDGGNNGSYDIHTHGRDSEGGGPR